MGFTPEPVKMKDDLTKKFVASQTEKKQDHLKRQQNQALQGSLFQVNERLTGALTGQQRGLQASQAGQRSQLAAQLSRLGVRGASQARQLKSFESKKAQELTQNRFAGEFRIAQLLEAIRAKRITEFQAQQAMLAQQQQQLLGGALQQTQQGEEAIGSLLGAAGTAAGAAFGGPIGAAAGSKIGGLFAPQTDK